MDLGLEGKRVLVTGGSRGIGFETALAFAREGALPILASRDATALESAAARIAEETGITATVFAGDLSQDGPRQDLANAHSTADILVNNAGAIPGGGLADISMDRWQEAWALKVFGYIHLCQLYAARMKQRGAGVIVNIIGMGGRAVRPDYICGAAGNAALIGFTNALGAETPAYGVRVFGINPSPTLTDRVVGLYKSRAASKFGDESRWQELLDESTMPFGRLKRPAEVGALAAMLCAPQVQYLSGTVIDMDGGGQWG
ncbi:MAG: SDR family oxidoreductase [Sulfitobacter sp.]|nr:SDR family oxidoreductase [Sulfitobacter sp.]